MPAALATGLQPPPASAVGAAPAGVVMERPYDLPSEELDHTLSRVHNALFGSASGSLSTMAQAHALLERMRQEIGLPPNRDGSSLGMLRAAREAASAVGL